MTRFSSLCIVFVLLFVLIFSSCTQSAPATAPTASPVSNTAAPVKVIKWTDQTQAAFGAEVPDRWKGFGYLPTASSAAFMLSDFMKKTTNGRLIIDTVPPGAIVPPAEILTAVEKGTVDCAVISYGSLFSGIIPEALAEIGLPFAWDEPWEIWDYMENWGGNQILDAVFAEHNIWRRTTAMGLFYGFWTNFDPSTPESFKGKKIRAGGLNAEFVQALGGSSMNIPTTETYMALKLGTVDGANYSAEGVWRDKLGEVTDYALIYPNTTPQGACMLFNKKSIEALPDDIKAILYQSVPHIAQTYGTFMTAAERWNLQQGVSTGQYKTVRWSEADAKKAREIAVTKVWESFGAKSPRCKQLLDALKAQLKNLGKL